MAQHPAQDIKKIVHISWLLDSIATGIQQAFDEKYIISTLSPLDRLHLVDEHRGRSSSASPALSESESMARTATPIVSNLPYRRSGNMGNEPGNAAKMAE